MKSNEMEFIDEIAIQITEQSFKEYTYQADSLDSRFTKEAQEFYNTRYDEIETLYINLILPKGNLYPRSRK